MSVQEVLQSILEKQIGKNNIKNITVSVQSADRKIDYCGAAGSADPDTGEIMKSDTPYFIASVSKMYTAAIILGLYQEHLIELDSPASAYIPHSLIDGIHVYRGTDYSTQITVRQLLNQTSGLADFETEKFPDGTCLMDELTAGNDRCVSTEEAVNMVRKLAPHFPPGTPGKAYYSNTNYRLLGSLIEAVSGKSMAENYQERICGPLGLTDTYLFDWTRPHERKPAVLFIKDKPANVPKYLSSNVSDGGLVSTAAENLIFLRAFFEGRLFDRSLVEKAQTWNRIFFPMKYGWGLMYFKLPRIMTIIPLPALVGHSGSTGSFAFFCPEQSIYLAGTLNQVGSPQAPFMLMMKLLRAARKRSMDNKKASLTVK